MLVGFLVNLKVSVIGLDELFVLFVAIWFDVLGQLIVFMKVFELLCLFD
jgi:hypothetical protein